MSSAKLYFLGFILLLVTACVYNNEEELYPTNDCITENQSYANDIVNILENNGCIGCHNTTNPGGSVNLDNYNDVKTYADNDQLLGSIKHSDGYVPMPLNSTSKIDACEIDKIEAWIYDGAENN